MSMRRRKRPNKALLPPDKLHGFTRFALMR
jgi:hypothetical protein